MGNLSTSDLKLGIIAGGQLGKMLIQESNKWGIISYVMDNETSCPAGGIANHYIQGSHTDFDAVYEFGKQVDLLTFEIESVNTDALFKLQEEGLTIYPDPSILKLIQDKGLQKQFYVDNNIPTAPFEYFDSSDDIINAIQEGQLSYPFVQKARKGGYDGRGVAVIQSASDIDKLLKTASIVEQKVNIHKEIAIVVARNIEGEIKCFPAVEMVFNEQANLVENIVCPANISTLQAHQAEKIAMDLIQSLDMVGLLAVEFFIDKEGAIITNESAPRTHNSGHHTIESIVTSQFEQHLRAVLGLPLGSTRLKLPSVMINLLGEDGHSGPVKYMGLEESMALEGVNIHLYGKQMTRPFRKMGHVTVLSSSVEEAISKAKKVSQLIKVVT